MKWLRRVLALVCLVGGCSVPQFGYQSVSEQTTNACRDGMLSPGEADIDCGGLCTTACESGRTCNSDSDCASASCSARLCTDQTCTDKLKNQDESDIDCGGVTGCPTCASGRVCNTAGDCASDICTGNICREPQTCSDKQKDQDETDVDCGGATGCSRCVPGKACLVNEDCDGGACTAGMCHAPSCTDGVKNQTESDIDCGGTCTACVSGKSCSSADDCNLSLCTGGKCRSQSCSDGLLNQDESDVDCGGVSGCARCATAQHCLTNGDCNNAACSKGSCQPTSCSDGVMNGTETDIDCGGSCKACAPLAGCVLAKDCTSLVCTAGATGLHKCAAPSCTDGVQNGNEPTTDCGGLSCPKCKIADTCTQASDCATNKCTSAHCVPTAATGTPLLGAGWLCSASQTENGTNVPNNVLDGNVSTHWSNGTPQLPGMWFMVDMLKPQVFFSVSVSETSVCCDYGKTMRISGSMDGKTFTELKTNIAGTNSLKITFTDPQYARYLKLELLEATDQLWWRIDDVIVAQ